MTYKPKVCKCIKDREKKLKVKRTANLDKINVYDKINKNKGD